MPPGLRTAGELPSPARMLSISPMQMDPRLGELQMSLGRRRGLAGRLTVVHFVLLKIHTNTGRYGKHSGKSRRTVRISTGFWMAETVLSAPVAVCGHRTGNSSSFRRSRKGVLTYGHSRRVVDHSQADPRLSFFLQDSRAFPLSAFYGQDGQELELSPDSPFLNGSESASWHHD
jgi:hypothetical protein